MVSKEFERHYQRLNTKQREAVDAIEGPVMVVAGPGTGKTTILTLRIANILKKTDTAPDSILALTFTDSGIRAMRRKLVEIIGVATYRVHIHTFHSFANEIIKRFPQEFPRIVGSQHVTDIDQIRIMEEVIDSVELLRLRPAMNQYFYLRPTLSHIKELKREDITPDEFERLIATERMTFEAIPDRYYESGKWKGEMKGTYKGVSKKILNNLELLKIYRAYQDALCEERLYDYEDMIMETVRVLKANGDLLLRLQEEYQYVLADEHQDANNAQNKLLELISGFHDNPNLFIVGDEKQAIFRFQGATLENFLYFKKKFPAALIVRLEENFRSDQTLLDATHKLISHNKQEDSSLCAPLLSASKLPGHKIFLAECETIGHEYEFLAKSIREKISRGIAPEHIAVLYRNNKDAHALKLFFDGVGLLTTLHSEKDLFADDDIVKLMHVLRAANMPGDEVSLAAMLYVDFLGLNHFDVHRAIHGAYRARVPLSRMVRSRELLEKVGIESPQEFLKLAEKIHHWSVTAKNKGLIQAFQKIAEDSGFMSTIIAAPNSIEKLLLYEALLTEVKTTLERHKNARLADFLTFLDRLTEHEMTVKSDSPGAITGRVNLMTAHKSKGQEFEVVYIIHTVNGRWGNLRSRGSFFTIPGMNVLGDEHELDDERRLFYVALTRARKEAIISWARTSETGKEALPSQFVEEIDPDHEEKIETGTFSRRAGLLEQKDSPSFPIMDVKDKKYLQELFLEEGLSVTALNNFLRCPWQYFFVNLIRIPRAEDKPQLYGTAAHETLKEFFDAYAREEDMSKLDALKLFEFHLSRKHLESKDFEELLKKGKKALGGYFDFYKNSWTRSIFNEFKIGGVFLTVEYGATTINLLVKGNLDKVEILPNGKVNVVDYKTGKPRTRNDILGTTASSEGDYGRQLVFYKLLLDGFQEGRYKMVSGEIDFIEPDERGKYHREKFLVSDTETDELKKQIIASAQDILNLSFWNKTCDDKKCQYCKLAVSIR